MRKSNFFSAVFSLFLLVPASITRAQVTKTINGTVRYQSGMSETKFSTPNGNIVVNLPQSMTGSVITGTVSTQPAGKTEKEKSRNLKELLKYFVILDGQKISLSTLQLPFDWLVRLSHQPRTPLELLNGSGVKVAELSLPPVLSAPAILSSGNAPRLSAPSNVLVKGDALNIYTSQQFKPGEKFVLTDSKGQQFIMSPICLSSQQAVMNVPDGASPGNCSVSSAGLDAPILDDNSNRAFFNLIDINLSSPNTNLRPGELSNVQVVVSTGTIKPMWSYRPDYVDPGQPEQLIIYPCIDLRNLNPNTVTMEGGNLQRIQINTIGGTTAGMNRGYTNPMQGLYEIKRNITGNAVGSFSVSATLHEDFNTSNDPFRPQLNVLNTPEDFNAWADALKKDLKQFAILDDYGGPTTQDYSVIKTNAQRAIDNMPFCTSPEQLDECKAVAYSLLQPLHVSKGAATMWLSTVEVYKAAIKAIPSIISGNAQLINWELIKNGLAYTDRMGKMLGYDLQNASKDAVQLVSQIQTEGEIEEYLKRLEDALNVIDTRMKKALIEMPVASKILLSGGLLFSTKFTPPGTTELPVEVIDIYWWTAKSGPRKNSKSILVDIHYTGDFTAKEVSVRVSWKSKDGKKSGFADKIIHMKDEGGVDGVKYNNCQSYVAGGIWPDDFIPTGMDKPLPKDELDLDKVKVTVFVNGKKVGEGKPEED